MRERQQIRQMLAAQYGPLHVNENFDRYMQLEVPDFCVVVEYHDFMRQIADAYVAGFDFPALTGACCLGERIFNMLLLGLRDFYKSTDAYKRLYRKETIDDWDQGIDALAEWGVISGDTLERYRELKKIRHASVHCRPIVKPREQALSAVQHVLRITDALFGLRSDIFFWAPGEPYIRSERERDPIVQKFFIPACARVGYKHRIDNENGRWVIRDATDYEDREVDDAEFCRLREEWKRQRPPGNVAAGPTSDAGSAVGE